MTFRFSKWLAYSKFAAALAMAIALYIGTQPMLWGWLLFAPLFLYIVYEGARSYSYAITIDDDLITVSGFDRAQYRISEITAVNVWLAKGGRIAVITFADQSKFNFPCHLAGFKDLVALLRTRTGLEKPVTES